MQGMKALLFSGLLAMLVPIAKPLSLAEMLQHRACADIYFVY